MKTRSPYLLPALWLLAGAVPARADAIAIPPVADRVARASAVLVG